MQDGNSKIHIGLIYLGLFLGLFLGLGFVFQSMFLSSAIKSLKSSKNTISIKGYAEKSITSDLAEWSATFSVSSNDLKSGYVKLKSDLKKILTFLERKGIKKENMRVASVSTEKRYKMNERGMRTDEIGGYNLTQVITVTSNDVRQISLLSDEVTELIQDGIDIISNPPNYFYTKLNDLKIEMLGEATKDARMRAEQLATNSGAGTTLELSSAYQGVFQITAPNSTEVSDYGSFDTQSIEKVIKAVVTIEYTIK
jgi:uncharacterized protein